jgi:endonuclease-3
MPASVEAKRHAAKIARCLAKHYPNAVCSLNFHTPLELLIATILSAQCTDVQVNRVTQSLFAKYPDAAHYAHAKLSELEQDIQSTGFYRNKAKNIQNCCRVLLEQFDGRVPNAMDKLVQLPGVGRKTANVVLGTAYGIAVGIVVDTHVTRLSQRLGLTREKTAEKIELDLMGQFAKKNWIALSHRLIQHGRAICTARSPKCDACPLLSLCPQIGVRTKPSVFRIQ